MDKRLEEIERKIDKISDIVLKLAQLILNDNTEKDNKDAPISNS